MFVAPPFHLLRRLSAAEICLLYAGAAADVD